jgi:hypothetical protein
MNYTLVIYFKKILFRMTLKISIIGLFYEDIISSIEFIRNIFFFIFFREGY